MSNTIEVSVTIHFGISEKSLRLWFEDYVMAFCDEEGEWDSYLSRFDEFAGFVRDEETLRDLLNNGGNVDDYLEHCFGAFE